MGKGVKPVNLGTRLGFDHVAATIAEMLDVSMEVSADSLVPQML